MQKRPLRSGKRSLSTRHLLLDVAGVVTLALEIVLFRAFPRARSRPVSARLLRRLYVITKGRSHRVLHRFLARRPRGTAPSAPVLEMISELRQTGVLRINHFLAREEALALSNEVQSLKPTVQVGYRVFFDPEDLISIGSIAEIARSETLVSLAEGVLKSRAFLTQVSSWVSRAPSPVESNEFLEHHKALDVSAQMFHFDADWIRFVKFFVYLSDVDLQNGPFAIVPGTHLAKPIWRDGRISEQEMASLGLLSREVRLCGNAGTLIAADTSAFHRGSPLVSGTRHVLQIEFASSLIGGSSQYKRVMLPTKGA